MQRYLMLCLFLFFSMLLYAQKPTIEPSVLGKWPSVQSPIISDDGNFVSYVIDNIPSGGHTLIVKSTKNNWEKSFKDVSWAGFSGDKLFFKNATDSLVFLLLGTDKEIIIPGVSIYRISSNGEWLAYQLRGGGSDMFLRKMSTQESEKVSDVIDFSFSESGNALVVETNYGEDSSRGMRLEFIDLLLTSRKVIWEGLLVNNYTLGPLGHDIAFIADIKGNPLTKSLFYYKEGMDKPVTCKKAVNSIIDSNLIIKGTSPIFSKDGNRIFFELTRPNSGNRMANRSKVDIWTYKDRPMQSEQLMGFDESNVFKSVVNLKDMSIVQLEQHAGERIIGNVDQYSGDYMLLRDHREVGEEFWWDKSLLPSVYLISLVNGSRKLLKSHVDYWPESYFDFPLSVNNDWIIYFDKHTKSYFSYDIKNDITRNITKDIHVPLNEEYYNDWPQSTVYPVGVCGWLTNEDAILIYDNYDIWKVDPAGKKAPINVTDGYGRINHIKFQFIGMLDSNKVLTADSKLLLSGFNPVNKQNGFYSIALLKKNKPELLTMGPYNWCRLASQSPPKTWTPSTFIPLKATKANIWIVRRMGPTEAPNYFLTKDFKNYLPISNIQPQKDYNWITAELIRWKTPKGETTCGILYKPENFDAKKKYPILFNYYEKLSDMVYDYPEPDFTYNDINIPYFVSNGYLVFIPDINYKIGRTGESALNSITSAVQYLSKYPWVNIAKMGVQGHSFGGYQTNYIITHTNLFAAAAEVAGQADLISGYGQLSGWGSSRQYMYESNQGRLGATLWQAPQLYLQNSPIFNIDKVVTPLLMMHNKRDPAVPWEQAVELFTALRRLGKKVWMLQYDEGGHSVDGNDARDYTLRLTQFFNYYLKDSLPPRWMVKGIPAEQKGVDTGLDLDMSGMIP